MPGKNATHEAFIAEARRIRSLAITQRVNRLGGYGEGGEVIYDDHPDACPSVLVDNRGEATATFMSNGSVGFSVRLEGGFEMKVLESHFDTNSKREIGVPSSNLWLRLESGGFTRAASLMNPRNNLNLAPVALRLVKLGDPGRAYWYFSEFELPGGVKFSAAVRLSLAMTPQGPALLRQAALFNTGRKPVKGSLFTHFDLHGTQRFVYNKDLWYDAGLPLSGLETVVAATVPYTTLLQLKRQSTALWGLKPVGATCDYTSFIGRTSAQALMPEAVAQGRLLRKGAGSRLNRFATPTLAGNGFSFALNAGQSAVLCQSLLAVTDCGVLGEFRKNSGARAPRYKAVEAAFRKASEALISATPGALAVAEAKGSAADAVFPDFELQLPHDPIVARYANSVWIGVKELYENCRAHGAKMADGIELGTRDRGQDMWPKMKEDPARVRADLIHVLSFLYRTVDRDPEPSKGRLTLREKLHGMVPRQYPSQWRNRKQAVPNDNRPYTDSPLWLIDALSMLVRETGDFSILLETTGSVHLTHPDKPETSGVIDCDKRFRVVESVLEIFACFERHAADSPYGMAQVLYGDWCDPVDMFGTSVVGDASTRGQGRGSHARLSAHLFLTLVDFIDLLHAGPVAHGLKEAGFSIDAGRLERFADRLRQSIVKWTWEESGHPGFINVIHELKKDGSAPDYARGERGYTLGSMSGSDYDGEKRRELGGQAFGLAMLNTNRPWLTEIPGTPDKIKAILKTMDTLFYHKKLGLLLFTVPMGNNEETIRYVGRMGLLPVGTAENGEYHHGQVMMHRFRIAVDGQADTAWAQFKPVMSALRDETIGGPFETPCTSYVADPDDPHFSQAMYFGLSGSTDWIVEIFQSVVGLRLNLHDPSLPSVKVEPNLPAILKDELTYRRRIHRATGPGRYEAVPFTLKIIREGKGKTVISTRVTVNGKTVEKAEVKNLEGMKQVEMEIVKVYEN